MVAFGKMLAFLAVGSASQSAGDASNASCASPQDETSHLQVHSAGQHDAEEYGSKWCLLKSCKVAKKLCLFGDKCCDYAKVCKGPQNPCAGSKPTDNPYFDNVNCIEDGVKNVLEQSGINVTKGYVGGFNTSGREPIMVPYAEEGLCPVNVHWHWGTEHYSEGEYDVELLAAPMSKAPDQPTSDADFSLLQGPVRQGFQCRSYNSTDPTFTTEYAWKYCKDTYVGETYEVHWPHSAGGACDTKWQYQTPFYDGVFCRDGGISLDPLNTYEKIGVQAQVFTIVNDEDYYVPDLFKGMIVNGNYGSDIAYYTGSTTGTSRSNTICSRYTPITWQVDRKCHLISASSFDKMCKDMKAQADDMTDDLHPHGSRELVDFAFAADNLQLLQAQSHRA